jgi:hypothetical protein
MKIVKFNDGDYGIRRWNWALFCYQFYYDDRGIYGWHTKTRCYLVDNIDEAKKMLATAKKREDLGVKV